ncbi:two-component system sensor histidine kinase DesK [Herbihabitans rhizosphaerae]|uniref:Two-component system sensor histidine kinase DesK n=1 Tax=Herbihabitans rhizosphaerae TaxID=1872711 RepID=A0A4Q7L2H6_9PSEU|nr:sensor histidine kinase [Herbihabitans rhizosphaerae]RZS43417.1 two-component system sensor histidine kinase DesK [Herbihabitans rhizosphaerae]
MSRNLFEVEAGADGLWAGTLPAFADSRKTMGRRWTPPAAFFLLFMLVPGVPGLLDDGMTTHTVVSLILLTAYSGAYLVFPVVMWGRSIAARVLLCCGLLLLGGGVVVAMGPDSLTVMIYATAVIAFAMPFGWALSLNGAAILTLVVIQLVEGTFVENIGVLVTVVSITIALFFMGQLIQTIRQLRNAQDEIATLAVSAERERLARDLHDILGHSLTTITVKAGLARRVLESQADTARAIEEIREVEGLSRRALSDVRATVSDYREVSLSAELVGARAALRAAEIDADLPHAVDNVRSDLQGPFGYVLREAITNVVRHSGARTVTVRLGPTWIEVTDDGAGSGSATPGNGLRGLSERLRGVGGKIESGPVEGGGFRLTARVSAPLKEHV